MIAAIDLKRGIADEKGIPWQGRLLTDTRYYREKLKTGNVLMGFGTYKELSRPYPGVINYVASTNAETILRPGFQLIRDARSLLQHTQEDVWNIGGAVLFANTLDLADELYLTRLDADFHCTKFFPPFEGEFVRAEQSDSQTENGISFRFEVWKRRLNK